MSGINLKIPEKNNNLAAEFSKNGFIVLKNVFSEKHCEQFRTHIFDTLNELKALNPSHRGARLTQSQAFSIPGLWEFLVHEKVVQALKEILEREYTLIPNFCANKNYFGGAPSTIAKITIPNRYGWHTDAGGEPFTPDHVAPDYRVIKCGLYLQDNDSDFGGGIDVVPGSHNLLCRTGMDRLDGKIRLLKGKLGIIFTKKTVPIKKGDVVIFDSFLLHASTNPESLFKNFTENEKKLNYFPSMPLQKTKITMYFDACRTQFALPFLNVAVQRAKKELESAARGETKHNLSFCNQISFFFEQKYPKEFLEKVKKQDIQIGRLDGSGCYEEARRVYQKYKALQI
jgi:ectoine hydroxylase-related dioxygenase (phytanoyl-CoA dioxygenase family)